MDRKKWCRIIHFGVNDGDNDYDGGGDGITITSPSSVMVQVMGVLKTIFLTQRFRLQKSV